MQERIARELHGERTQPRKGVSRSWAASFMGARFGNWVKRLPGQTGSWDTRGPGEAILNIQCGFTVGEDFIQPPDEDERARDLLSISIPIG